MISNRRFQILKELEEGEKTPTQLSKELNLSVSSVYKHLEKLKENNMVKKSGKKEGKTRPYQKYKLEDFLYFLYSLDGRVKRRRVKIREVHKVHLRIWSIPQKEFHRPLEKFWCLIQEDIDEIKGLLVYGSVVRGQAREESDVDVLIVSGNKDLDEKYQAKVVGKQKGKKGKLIMAKVLSAEELRNKLKAGSNFALNLIKEGLVIYDPTGILKNLKDEFKG